MLNSEPSALSSQLRRYFYSGWAFLIPYLAVYLLYAWLKWPVNPASELMKGASGRSAAAGMWLPSLLYIYWILHALNLVLAAIALRSWWNGTSPSRSTRDAAVPSSYSLHATLYSLLPRLAPWALLALIFNIPGLYIEWPSDPWEHLRRINEWHAHSLVTDHSVWKKASYFLPYSLTCHLTGVRQLNRLNIYYTTVCLLLSWQYYRFARAVGLGKRASFIFVILNAFAFGNNLFSFYRYYGLSSSIFAQLYAVALTRIAVQQFGSPRNKPKDAKIEMAGQAYPLLAWCSALLRFGGAGAFLLTLIAFSHLQALGIGVIGVGAVIAWRLIKWKRLMIGWLGLAAVLLGVASVLWLPRDPTLDDIFRPQGWISRGYSLVSFDPQTPCFTFGYGILGMAGLLNLIAGLVLLIRGHIIGMLTWLPPLLMGWPAITIPILNRIASRGHLVDLAALQRLHFAAPSCLALVMLGTIVLRSVPRWAEKPWIRPLHSNLVPLGILIGGLTALTCLSPGRAAYIRTFNLIGVPPADLEGWDLTRTLHPAYAQSAAESYDMFISPLGFGFMADALGLPAVGGRAQHMPGTTAARDEVLFRIVGYGESHLRTRLYLPSPRGMTSPYSTAGYLSGHWSPWFIHYDHCSIVEYRTVATRLGFRPIPPIQIYGEILQRQTTVTEPHRADPAASSEGPR